MATSYTALQIITEALIKLNVYSSQETINQSDAALGLNRLNDMLDSWSNENLMCYANLEQSGVLVAGQSSYTIGPGGNFNVTRPISLIGGPGAAYALDSNLNRYLVDVIEQDQFNMISQPGTNSDVPCQMFYDPQFPLGIINVQPIPNIAMTLYWDSRLQLTEFSSLTATVGFPPGYSKAIKDCLAVELWDYYKNGQQIPASTMMQANDAKGNIKRSNQRVIKALYDPEIVSKCASDYNGYTDSPWNSQ